MFELINGQGISDKPYFLIDFEDVPVGTQGLNVISRENWNFQRITQGTPTDGVVDHPTYGKCYRLDGNVRFQEATKRFDLLRRPKFTIEVDYVSDVAYAQLWDWGSQSGGKQGWNAYQVQQGSRWMWIFFASNINGAGSAVPYLTGTPPINQLVKLRFVRDGTFMTVTNTVSGASETFNIGGQGHSDMVNGLFSMTNAHSGNMKGYIKRFEIIPS